MGSCFILQYQRCQICCQGMTCVCPLSSIKSSHWPFFHLPFNFSAFLPFSLFNHNYWIFVFIFQPGYVILVIAVILYVALFLFVVHLDDWARGLAILVEFKTSQVSSNHAVSEDAFLWRLVSSAQNILSPLQTGTFSLENFSSQVSLLSRVRDKNLIIFPCFLNSHSRSSENKSWMRVDESWQARVCMRSRVFSTLMHVPVKREQELHESWWELRSESLHESFLNSYVRRSSENKSCMRVDESWQARVCTRVFSTLMSGGHASENKSCMRVVEWWLTEILLRA